MISLIWCAWQGILKVPKTTGLQYLCNKYAHENVKDEVDFLPTDKCQSDTTT